MQIKPYESIDFMTPMRNLLENPPFLEEWETLKVDYMQIDPQAPIGTGNAVAIAGMPRPVFVEDVQGNVLLRQEINWIFTMRRFTNDNELRKDIGNFIANFNLWINTLQAQRNMDIDIPEIPKFGDTDNEEIIASGGMGMGATQEPNVDEFQIQIHIMFEKYFEGEEF